MKANRILGALGAIAVASPLCVAHADPAQQTPAYRIVETILLGAPDKWDFVEFDPSSNRVFVS